MSDEKQFVPVILDREINSPEADAFGHRHFSMLMQGLIESSRNEPPYSIGLLGRWGSGKSSIKSLYLTSLNDDASSSSDRKSRSKRIHPITFNAWRFGGEGIKRALLRQVYLELGGDKNKLDDALFKQIQKSQPLPVGVWDQFKESFGKSAFNIGLVIFVFVFIVGLAALIGWLFKLTGTVVMGALGTIAVASAVTVVKFLLDAAQSTRNSTITKMEAPRSSSEQYEDFLIEQFQSFKEMNKACERIVIFVDDLDRLSPDEMISGLDAVRTFMEIPKNQLPKGLGVVFVISCDEDRIADALADKHRRSASSELPGAVFTHADAHRFLDRIFQFRLEIPPFPKRDMRNHAETALLKAFPDLRSELKALAIPLETLIDRMIHVGVSTPRNALQIVNAFVQSWWIAKRRERDGAGTESPGGLQEGAITKHPLALGAVCALRVDFPDFFRDLQREPELIKQFTDVFIRGIPIENLPDSVQNILRRYHHDGKVELPARIRPEHRALRQFIASLQGLRWPKAMRPLLFFSQDPVSRKYGDKALALYESFVSGDKAGVLVQLGRDHDAKKLSESDMRLLHEMVEELDRESDVRRNNAAAVLASLGDRYPDETAHLLLTPLAQRVVESAELRWRLGVTNIGRSIGPISPSDRREVASCLVNDFLKMQGLIEFRLETGEPPSLDEAMQMVRETCSIALEVQKNDGLDDQHFNALLSWLESRRVALSGREQSLTFGELESWVSTHESWLLPALGGRYTQLIIDKLEKDGTNELEISDVVRRSRSVFDALHDAGEDSRKLLFKQLNRFVGVSETSFVVLASSFAKQHVNAIDKSDLSEFLTAFANRLKMESPSQTNMGLNLAETGRLFVEIFTERMADLESSCEQPVADLLANWSLNSETAILAADLLTPFCEQFANSSKPIISDWSSRLLSNLTVSCIDWLAANFTSILSEQQRNDVIAQLDKVLKPDEASEQEIAQYGIFVTCLPKSGWATPQMQEHQQKMFETIRSVFSVPDVPPNPNPQQRQQKLDARKIYLRRVFVTIPHQLQYAENASYGAMINEVFVNAKSDQNLFGWLHCQMADYWPDPRIDTKQYDAELLFSNAMELAESVPNDSVTGPIRTMTSFVNLGFVTGERAKDVVNTACRLWHRTPEQAIESLKLIVAFPDSNVLAAMIDGIDPASDDGFSRLRDAWKTSAQRMASNERLDTAVQILSKTPKGTQSEPDLCLRLWLNARDDDRQDLVESLIEETRLNDDQKMRVWSQIEQLKGLETEFLFNLLPKVAGLSDSPKTVAGLLDFEKNITAKVSNEEERFALGKQIVEAFRASSSQEAKNRLALWLKTLNVEPVLQELSKHGELSEDEVGILDTHFSRSKHWKKVKER